ncbi:MAG: uridine kinase [Ruminococcaceae bacterium]|nr:uridine kinase [Oscillospiraceae bacterium]
MADILNEILSLLPPKADGVIVIAIDGRCGAGKTTLATKLAAVLDCDVVHTDDFFLPPRLRTPERYAEVGGNVDYERLYSEVISKIGKSFSYRRFDCSTMSEGKLVRVRKKDFLIVEGAYSLHPHLGKYYDIAIFCDVDSSLQRARILKRNGAEKLKAFENKWIPLEDMYFSEFQIPQKCHKVIFAGKET